MNITTLVEQFEALGIELSRDGEQLRFRAPQGVVTPALKQRLSEKKTELLRHLSAQEAARTLTINPVDRHEPFPLTEAQSAYLLGRHSVYAFGGLSCRGYLEIAFPAEVPPTMIERAWHALIRRHDMLRIVIEEEGYQRVLEQVSPAPLPVDDLRKTDDVQIERHLDEQRDAMLSAPADYACWPLFKARLCRCHHQTLMLLAIDLILVDAASLYLLVDELAQLILDQAELPPPPQVTFRDYVIARRAHRSGRGYREAREYWRDKLDAFPAAPDLPMAPALPLRDVPDPGPFKRRSFVLTTVQATSLRTLSAELDSTVTVLALTAFAETLGVWSQTRHFTLNLPIFRREPLHPEIDRVIGDFTSVTLLEVDLDSGGTFGERVSAVGRRLFSDLDHAAFSGLEVLAELTRRQGAPVLMPVVFTSTVGGVPGRLGPVPGYAIRRGLTQTPQVSIDCQLTEQAEEILIAWDVREGLFPDGMIDHMFAAFRDLMQRLGADGSPVLAVSHPVVLREEQTAVRRAVNATGRTRKEPLLHEALISQAERHPESLALHDHLGLLNYGELLFEARAVAAGLVNAGCRPRERVAILCAKGRGQAIGALAVLLCGACYVPIDIDQPALRREAILANAGIRYAIADPGCALPASVSAIRSHPNGDFSRTEIVSPEDPAYVIYTSGSTGTPKGVVISHAAAWNTVDDINRRFDVSADDRVLALANLSFDLSVYDLFGVLAAGGALICPDEDRKADPSHWAELAARHGVSLWNSVPAQLQMLCDAVDGGAPVPSALRLAMVSGDWVPLDLAQRLHRHCPQARLISLGGATEAAIWSVFHPVRTVEPHWLSIPYGTPLANQRLHVVDEHWLDRPDWVVGQIAIAGDGLALGYLNDPEKTARQFVDRPDGERLYLTGDLGRYWPDGTIEFLGRRDGQVKIRGHRVELGEIASALRAHPAVGDTQVLVGDGPGRPLCAFVELARGRQPEATEVLSRLEAQAAEIECRIDRDAFSALMDGADRVAILSMAAQLRADGLFASQDLRHGLPEIYRLTQTAPVHQRLLRRWLDGLVDARALRRDGDSLFYGLVEADAATVRDAWADVDALERQAGYGSQTLHYIRVCADQLSGLLRGEVDVRAILFPQGELETAHAAYRDNLVSRSMNGMVVTVVRALAERQRGLDPIAALRVLEVGAGVAGTATDLVPGLADFTPEYWFTDLSEFFLSEARHQFADYPWMRYGIFDMNSDAGPQGLAPNSFDVILCANVLHNARHAGAVLGRFSQLLAPGGCVVFVEPFRKHNYPLLVSMEFFPELTGFTDSRADNDQTFFTRDQWMTWLDEAGAVLSGCAPAADNVLAKAGQGVFVAQFKCDRAAARTEDLRRFLGDQLPIHMVPAQIQALDVLPRLRNGKADRAALSLLIQTEDRQAGTMATSGAAPRDELEQQVAAVWAEILGLTEPACDLDFYAQGGDSLLLSRMIARLRQQVPAAGGLEWEVLLRQVLHEPTIRALADRLRGNELAQSDNASRNSVLVPLWGDTAAGGRCCVLVHAGTGNLLPYQHLLAALDRSPWASGIGVELPSQALFTNLPADQALAKLAERYAAEIADQGADFTLVGYCLGGLLAAEIARILTERGKTVSELIAISSYQPPHVEAEPLVDYVFARALGVEPARIGLPEEQSLAAAVSAILRTSPDRITADAFGQLEEEHRGVANAFALWQEKTTEERLASLAVLGQGEGVYSLPEATNERFSRDHALFAHSMASVGLHRPDAWLGRTLLLRNSASDPLLPGTPQDVAGYWREICLGELVVENIPGDHFSCLSRANATGLAALIALHVEPVA